MTASSDTRESGKDLPESIELGRRTFLVALAGATPGVTLGGLPALPPGASATLETLARLSDELDVRAVDAVVLVFNGWADDYEATERHLATLARHGYATATYFPALDDEPAGYVYELTEAGRRRAGYE